MSQESLIHHVRRESVSQPTPRLLSSTRILALETPISRPAYIDFVPSAMKGVVLTSTGETLATPSQAELSNLFKCSPKVGLNFAKIFDFEGGDHDGTPTKERRNDGEEADRPPSPSSRKSKEQQKKERDEQTESSSSTSSTSDSSTTTTQVSVVAPTRLRRPSIRSSTRPTHTRSGTLPASTSEPAFLTMIPPSSTQPKPLPHPHLRPSKSISNLASNPPTMTQVPAMPDHRPAPEYDFTNEENLPSPFLKKTEKNFFSTQSSGGCCWTYGESHCRCFYISVGGYINIINIYCFTRKEAA